MDLPVEINIFSSESEEEENDLQLVIHRRPYTVRPRTYHMQHWDDVDFVARFRLSKATVQQLHQRIERLIRYPTDRNFALSPLDQLLICLRFYATGNTLTSVGDFTGVHLTTASKVIKRVTEAICTLKREYIYVPELDTEEYHQVQQGFYRIASFPRVLLALDCTHVRLQSPGGNQAETFRNRKGWFSLNVQAACDHNLKIRNIVARWPGSVHDSIIFQNSQVKATFDSGRMGNALILGDSGYANEMYLMTPLGDPANDAQRRYNESQIRTRNVVERCFGVLKRRFPVLALGIRLDIEIAQDIIVATSILHNVAIEQNEPELQVDPEIEAVINDSINVEGLNVNEANIYRNELINQYFARLERI